MSTSEENNMIDLADYEEDDYDDNEYDDEEDYDYEELTDLEEETPAVFDFRTDGDEEGEDEEQWGFHSEESDNEVEEDDEYYEEEYEEGGEEDYEDEEYEDDDDDEEYEHYEEDEEYDNDSQEPEELAPTRPVEPPERDNAVVASVGKSERLNGDLSEGDDTKEKDGDGEPIFEKLFNSMKDGDFAQALSPYDNFMSTVLAKLSAIPIVGKLFSPLSKNKIATRLAPLIILVFVYGVCFALSLFFGADKQTTVLLPDSGEVTLTSNGYDKKENTLALTAENTGGVITSFTVEDMSLFTYDPGINPLSWTKFKEIGTCSLPDTIVEDVAELTAQCEIKEGEKVSFRTRATIKEEE